MRAALRQDCSSFLLEREGSDKRRRAWRAHSISCEGSGSASSINAVQDSKKPCDCLPSPSINTLFDKRGEEVAYEAPEAPALPFDIGSDGPGQVTPGHLKPLPWQRDTRKSLGRNLTGLSELVNHLLNVGPSRLNVAYDPGPSRSGCRVRERRGRGSHADTPPSRATDH